MSEDTTLNEFVDSGESEEVKKPELIQGVAWSKIDFLPDNWEAKNIESYINILSGNNFSSDYFVEEGGVPLIRIRDLAESETTVNFEGNYDSKYLINQQDLVVGMDGEFEPHLWSGPQALLNQRVCKIEPEIGYNKIFFRYAIEKPLFYIQKSIAGTTVKHLSQSNINDLNLPTPPLPEQRKIATVLHNVDQAIEKIEKLVEQTKRVQRGVEERLFREGYFDHPNIEEKRLVTLPKDWDFDQLSKHSINSAFGPRFGSERYDDEGDISTLRTTDLNDRGHISLETMPVADLEREEIKEHLLKPGDFMITRSGTTGIGTVWGNYDKPTIPGAFLIRFRFEDTLNPHFMKYYVNSSIGRNRVNRRAKGGVQKNLAGSDLLNMRFPIPSKEEQDKIVEVLDTIENRIKHERNYKSKLMRLKQGLQQDLLSGTVRTTDTKIEVPDEIAQHG